MYIYLLLIVTFKKYYHSSTASRIPLLQLNSSCVTTLGALLSSANGDLLYYFQVFSLWPPHYFTPRRSGYPT